jgi:hypothetical protein
MPVYHERGRVLERPGDGSSLVRSDRERMTIPAGPPASVSWGEEVEAGVPTGRGERSTRTCGAAVAVEWLWLRSRRVVSDLRPPIATSGPGVPFRRCTSDVDREMNCYGYNSTPAEFCRNCP